jgi:hypothetical protein
MTGETRGITGEALEVDGEGEGITLSTLSFGRLELRRRMSKKPNLLYCKALALLSSAEKPQFSQPNRWSPCRVLCPCARAWGGLSEGREAWSG